MYLDAIFVDIICSEARTVRDIRFDDLFGLINIGLIIIKIGPTMSIHY